MDRPVSDLCTEHLLTVVDLEDPGPDGEALWHNRLAGRSNARLGSLSWGRTIVWNASVIEP